MDTHSIDYKRYHNKLNTDLTTSLFDPSLSTISQSSLKNKTLPKGHLSEYQHNYLNNGGNKNIPQRPKDTLSFGNKSLLQESFILENIKNNNNDQNQHGVRSKALDRLYSMLPDGSVSWYQADFSYYGSEQDLNKSIDLAEDPIKTSNNPISQYKNNYIKNFEEINKGFVDTYSIAKGGALLQVKNDSARPIQSHDNFNYSSSSSQSAKVHKNNVRDHDLRSVWIPKKFEGRNMFASHIDSTIFPEKNSKPYETAYSQNFDSSVDAKKVFDKPPYERIEKSVKYAMNHENKYVPSIRWYPNQPQPFRPEEQKEPIKSIYQADFDKPKTAPMPSISDAKVNDKQAYTIYTLEQIQKRKNEIDNILANR